MRGLLGVASAVLVFALSTAAFASEKECANLLTEAIPVKWVEKMIREGRAEDPQTQRLREIVQRNGFSAAALNQQIIRAHNEYYTFELAQGPITNQKQSGRCWIFAGLNMIRSELIAQGKVPANFEFSENYLHFFNMLEKSNRYLERVLSKTYSTNAKERPSAEELRSVLTPDIGDGGWYQYFMFLVNKYGLVPKEAMPETHSSEQTATLLAELKRHLAGTAMQMLNEATRVANGSKDVQLDAYLEQVRAIKEKGMVGAWKILATHLGDPPMEFDFRFNGKKEKQGVATITPTVIARRVTPQRFAREYVKFDPNDYVVISAFPRRATETVYEQEKSAIGPAEGNMPTFDVRFLNVTPARLEELAVASIEGGQPVWFAADVSKNVDHASGVMHPEVYERDSIYHFKPEEALPPMSPAELATFSVSFPNHAMLLTGFDRPSPNGPVLKFKNENSWGDKVASRGVYHLYREWFESHVYQIIVHKKFLNETEQRLWDAPAVKIGEREDMF